MKVIQPAKRKIRRLAFHTSRAVLHTAGLGPARVVFILAHMRSGSTLLMHLLATHPKVIGSGESHTVYHSPDDLDRLCLWARVLNRVPLLRLHYVADQIVHDDFTPDSTLLQHPRVRSIFLIREPIASISSLVRYTRTVNKEWTFQQATDSYIQRLQTLARQAEALRGHPSALALTHQDLIENTPATLRRLQTFMGLEIGFSEHYSRQKFTGVRGDRSANIHAGQVIRDRTAAPLDIPLDQLEQAWHAYHACRQTLNSL